MTNVDKVRLKSNRATELVRITASVHQKLKIEAAHRKVLMGHLVDAIVLDWLEANAA